MKEQTFHEVLELLEELRRNLPQDAPSRTTEGIDGVIARLREAHKAGEVGDLTRREVLERISEILSGLSPIASLIEAVLKSL